MLGTPVQIAYAVDDVVDAAQQWAARGIGPFFVIEHIELRNVRVRGEPGAFDHSSAYSQWGPLMVELICQHDGGADPIVGAGGVHHIAHFVDDFTTACSSLIEQNAVETLCAETPAGMPFAFYDARDARGHLIEIYERTERLGWFYEMVRTASVGWNGADPIRRL